MHRSYTSSARQSGPRTYPPPYRPNGCVVPSTSGSGGHPSYSSGLNKYPYSYQIAPAYSTSSVPRDHPTSPSHYTPSYSTTTTSSGPATSKSRSNSDGTTIFLSGLPYYQSETELRGTLQSYGPLAYLEIHPDSRNLGMGKGTARARFQTSHQALNAIRGLDGLCLGGRKISVKQAKDDVTIAATMVSSKTAPDTHRLVLSPLLQNQTKWSKSRGPVSTSAQADRSSNVAGHRSSNNTGPLVVNGARSSAAPSWRRNSQAGANESDESSNEESSNESSEDSSDDEEEDEDGKYSSKHGTCSLRSHIRSIDRSGTQLLTSPWLKSHCGIQRGSWIANLRDSKMLYPRFHRRTLKCQSPSNIPTTTNQKIPKRHGLNSTRRGRVGTFFTTFFITKASQGRLGLGVFFSLFDSQKKGQEAFGKRGDTGH